MSSVLRAGLGLALVAALMAAIPCFTAASVSAAPAATEALASCPDGAGGRWLAERGARGDAQALVLVHVGIDGVRANPIEVRRTGGERALSAQLRGDGRGGAWIAWTELDYVAMTTEVRAAHVSDAGVVLTGGDAALASFVDLFDAVSLLADGRGGAYVAWREADLNHDRQVRLARLAADGRPAAGWPARGLALAERQGNVRPHLVTDGEGGAIVVADPDPNQAGATAFTLRVSPAAALLR